MRLMTWLMVILAAGLIVIMSLSMPVMALFYFAFMILLGFGLNLNDAKLAKFAARLKRRFHNTIKR